MKNNTFTFGLLIGIVVLIVIGMLILPAPRLIYAQDPTLDAVRMTLAVAEAQATSQARATLAAQAATNVAIQQTAVVVSIQQTQAAVAAQQTKSALDMQAYEQAINLTGTAQAYQGSLAATDEANRMSNNAVATAAAIEATRQADAQNIAATATMSMLAVQATRQTLDEQSIATQRQHTGEILRTIWSIVVIVSIVALIAALVATLLKRLGQVGAPRTITQVVMPAGEAETTGPVFVPVPEPRIVDGLAASVGAMFISEVLNMQSEPPSSEGEDLN